LAALKTLSWARKATVALHPTCGHAPEASGTLQSFLILVFFLPAVHFITALFPVEFLKNILVFLPPFFFFFSFSPFTPLFMHLLLANKNGS